MADRMGPFQHFALGTGSVTSGVWGKWSGEGKRDDIPVQVFLLGVVVECAFFGSLVPARERPVIVS